MSSGTSAKRRARSAPGAHPERSNTLRARNRLVSIRCPATGVLPLEQRGEDAFQREHRGAVRRDRNRGKGRTLTGEQHRELVRASGRRSSPPPRNPARRSKGGPARSPSLRSAPAGGSSAHMVEPSTPKRSAVAGSSAVIITSVSAASSCTRSRPAVVVRSRHRLRLPLDHIANAGAWRSRLPFGGSITSTSAP